MRTYQKVLLMDCGSGFYRILRFQLGDFLGHVDTWAGRGGFGSKMLREHDIAAIIYGGTFLDEDFRDRNVADQWFQDKYQMKLSAKGLQATGKYRFDSNLQTGGTFGVNFATLAVCAFRSTIKAFT